MWPWPSRPPHGIIGSFGDWDWRDEVASIQAPVLLLYGGREAWPLAGVREYVQLLPNVGWLEFPNTGHHVWNEQTRTVVGMIDTFLRGDWPEGVNR